MNLKKIRIIGLIFTLCFCFSGCNKDDTSENTNLVENVTENKVKNGDIVFSTEYRIEDYREGCFIVSKSDGLLYGVLDDEGNEIISLKYDNIEFLDANTINRENQFLVIEYEGEKKIINSKGEIVIDKDINIIQYKLPIKYDENTPCFIYRDGGKMILYKENGDIVLERDYGKHDETAINFISDKYFVVSQTDINWESQSKAEISGGGVTLYDMEGEKINSWDNCNMFNRLFIDGDKVFFYVASENAYHKKIVDKDGNVEEDENIYGMKELENAIKADLYPNYTEEINTDKDTYGLENGILYKSNKTWKLTDEYGKAIYDERYYDCKEINGCYLLKNEDNEICLISSKGIKLIDYGHLTKKVNEIYFMNTELTEKTLFASAEKVYILVENNGKTDVYCFFENDTKG